MDWKPFKYYTTLQNIAGGIEYYRTIRLDDDGSVTKLGLYISQPEQETPPGFREFLEGAARQGYEHMTSFILADVESGKVTIKE